MRTFLLWILLLFFCWPLAILVLIAYPIIWVLLIPFKLFGIAVDGILDFITALIRLPARILDKIAS